MSSPDLTIPSLFNIRGQVAVVTGGGSGLGTMITAALVQNGAKVYISSRKEKPLKEVSEALTKLGPGSCHYFVTDLTTRAGCDALSAYIKSKESKVHILVNNSGASWGGPWNDFPEKEGWDRIFALNVKSLFYLTAGLSSLLAKDATNLAPGRVINISSIASVVTDAEGSRLSAAGSGLYSYHAAKASVNHLTKVQAAALSSKCVTVNAILPGVFPSKMTAYGFAKKGDELVADQPTGRVGIPQDIAGTVLFLVSPASAHVTSSLIMLDGGSTKL